MFFNPDDDFLLLSRPMDNCTKNLKVYVPRSDSERPTFSKFSSPVIWKIG